MNRRTFFKLLPALAAGTIAAAKAGPAVKALPVSGWQMKVLTDLVSGKRFMLIKGRQMGWSQAVETWHEFRRREKVGSFSLKETKDL